MQQHSLLQTKLYIPPIRRELVPRLIERLNAGLDGKLTVISAPAGFGKTTLVSEWVQAMGRAAPPVAAMGSATPPIDVAWLSLDELDMVIVTAADPFWQQHDDESWKHESAVIKLVGKFINSLPSE